MTGPGAVWVRTMPALDGDGYRPVLEIDEDTSADLGDGVALQHALTVLAAVTCAETDAAVLRQMSGGIPGGRKDLADLAAADDVTRAVELVALLREKRADLTWPTPLALIPGVSMRFREPFLHVQIRGRLVGQWTAAAARQHATGVIEASVVAALDTDYLSVLRLCDIPEAKARGVVDDLRTHREES